MENLSANVLELRNKIEKEAQQYAIAPEEMLVRSIRKTSALLNENFHTLKKQGVELVGEANAHHIDAATHFIEQLDNNFAKAENLYQIRDEVSKCLLFLCYYILDFRSWSKLNKRSTKWLNGLLLSWLVNINNSRPIL